MNTVYKRFFKFVPLVWGISIAAAVLTNIAVLAPQRELREQINNQLAEEQKTYTDLLKINEEKTKTRLKVQMAELRGSLSDFVASNEDLAGLTFDIGQMAKGLKAESFSISPQSGPNNRDATDGQYICECQMKVNFKSSFNTFAAFLNAVERYKPVIFVNKFAITHSEQDESVNKVSLDLSLFAKKKQGS